MPRKKKKPPHSKLQRSKFPKTRGTHKGRPKTKKREPRATGTISPSKSGWEKYKKRGGVKAFEKWKSFIKAQRLKK